MTRKKPTEVPSPCISVCTIDDDTGFCRGCFRTMEEVTKWMRYSDPEKLDVIKRLDERREKLGGKPGHC